MKVILQLMLKHSTGRTVSVLFALTMAVYLTMLLYTIPAVTAFAPEFPIFDLSPSGYLFSYANELLDKLGNEGRNIYLHRQLPLDFIYPGLFAVTYSLLLVWLFRKYFNMNSKVYYLGFVPILAGVFDYLENIFIIKMINSFPDLQMNTVKIASTLTILKSSFTIFFFVLLLMGFVLFLKRKFMRIQK